MKTRIIVIITVFTLVLSSCLVKSLHPFYHEKDVEFRENILGTWLDQDSATWIYKQTHTSESFMGPVKKKNSYQVKYVEENEDTSYFDVHLFNLEGKTYMDFYPLLEPNIGDDFATLHFIRSHSIARIDFFGDENFCFFWFDEDWLNDLFEQRKVKISHEKVDDSYILTAKTDELQKFISKYGAEYDIFSHFDPEVYNIRENNKEYHDLIESEMDRVNDSNFMGESEFIYSNQRKMN